jgi:diguanylate cyclase (GGDEF)-like protein/PAS domain S-box-containing protein
LLESEAKFRAISETALDAVILIDNNGKVMYWSPSAEKIFGYTRTEIMGKNLHSMIMPKKYSEQFEEGFEAFKKSGQGNAIGKLVELTAKDKNGREFSVEIALSSVNIQGQFWSSAIIRDITNRKETEETLLERLKQIEYLSFHDHLTGLYNRRYLEDAILRLDTVGNLPFTFMELDINGLKITNDAFGHEMGDKLIKAVADIIKKVCRTDDIIARIGGDEFAILLPHIDHIQADIIKHQIKDEALKTDLDYAIVSVAIGYRVKTGLNQNIIEIQKEADDDMYKDKIKHGKTIRSQMIENVMRNINSKYDDEQIHMERISSYCESIARAMNLNGGEISDIKVAGSLHDIGKIMIPSELLHKKGRLSEREWKIIKRHSEIGYQILRGVDEYAALAEAVLYHHERWDGKGYPKGLKGEAIPIQSRIIAVADAFEAMTTSKPYQKTKSKAEAIEELKKCAGSQFDQNIVRIFVEIVL